ncbi:hypothetical protein EI94DRAFT_668335 [Lactarius quietus]|nr:hypothetical protein EI94DRAFT_668335 [Lactarius quietus]
MWDLHFLPSCLLFASRHAHRDRMTSDSVPALTLRSRASLSIVQSAGAVADQMCQFFNFQEHIQLTKIFSTTGPSPKSFTILYATLTALALWARV